MELLPEQHAVTNAEVNELLRARRHARWASSQHTKRREGHHTSNKEARWLEAKVMKYLDSQPTARQSRASVSAAISALRPPQLETASGDELSEAEQLAVVNLPAMTLIDLHLVVEDAIGRLGGEEAAAGLVDTLNEIMFEPEAASLSETSTDWNNHHGSAPSTSALVSEFDSKESSAASASSASKGGNVADAASGGDDDSAAGNKKKGRRKRPRKR